MIRTLAATAATVAALLGLAAPPADASPRRAPVVDGCVDPVEWQATRLETVILGDYGRSGTQLRELEAAWGVTGAHRVDSFLRGRRHLISYPVCGLTYDEAAVWVVTLNRGPTRRGLEYVTSTVWQDLRDPSTTGATS